MKKLLTICLLMTATITVNAQEKKEYYLGKLSSIGNLTNGKKNGEWKFYHYNGQLSSIGKFVNDMVSGEWKTFDSKGILLSNLLFINGKENGVASFYHYNGQLKSVGNFTNGKRTGLWKYYHENGQLESIGHIDNFIANHTGEWKYYHPNGELKSIENSIAISEEIRGLKKENTWILVKNNGYKASLTVYDELYNIRENRAKVKRFGKIGFIDSKGKEVIGCEFDEAASSFENGKISVVLNKQRFIIDTLGNKVEQSQKAVTAQSASTLKEGFDEIVNKATLVKIKTDVEKRNLKGNIKSIVEAYYDGSLKFGELVKGDLLSHNERTFNESGYLTKEILVDDEEEKKSTSIIKYDDKGRMSEIKTNDDGLKSKTTFLYNTSGNCYEENTYNEKDLLDNKVKLKYNSQKQITERATYIATGEEYSKTEYKYNIRNQLEETNVFEKNFSSKSYSTYDEKGNIIEELIKVIKDGKSENSIHRYKFDVNNLIIETAFKQKDNTIEYNTYQYDINKNEILHKSEVIGVVKSTYIYDKKNNWIKCIQLIGKDNYTIQVREIVYY